ncbi:putative protein OS=Streptomyces microflavus OX=1919 GN=Smic_07780 PE=4 SV=1 [Streptomyces microflavus]
MVPKVRSYTSPTGPDTSTRLSSPHSNPTGPGSGPADFDGVEEPSGIAVPTDPVRAAATVTRRLLPRYEQALLEVLQQVEDLPEPAHHASRARTAPVITGLGELEAGLSTTALARQPASTLGGRSPIRRS